MTRPNLEVCPVTDVHNTYNGNMECKKHEPNKLKIVKEEIGHLNIVMFGISKLK